MVKVSIPVETHNETLRRLFTDTLERVKGIREEELEELQRDPDVFLNPYLQPIEEKGREKGRKKGNKGDEKEDVIQRAMAPFDPMRCHARIWNSGYGCQCSRKHSGDGFCGKHLQHHKLGVYNGPKPDDKSWKDLPEIQQLQAEVEEDVKVAPKAAKAVADRWGSAIVIQRHVRVWLANGTVQKQEKDHKEEKVAKAEEKVHKQEKPLSKMTKAQLSEKLRLYGLSTKGKKQELIDRLEERMAAGVGPLPGDGVIEEKPKKERKKKQAHPEKEDDVAIDEEAAQAVVERFAQLEADPEIYKEMEVYDYQDVEYFIDGDDLFDKLNPTRKVGIVDQDEDIVIWLSPEFEKEHKEKQGDEPDLSDISDSE